MNCWIMVWAVNAVKESSRRLERIEGTRFTAEDGKQLQKELMVNREIGHRIIERLGGSNKGESK